MCDPLIEDCPTEETTGQHLKDTEVSEESGFDSTEILNANLMIFGAAFVATFYSYFHALSYGDSKAVLAI